jgi:hypothetical protein
MKAALRAVVVEALAFAGAAAGVGAALWLRRHRTPQAT